MAPEPIARRDLRRPQGAADLRHHRRAHPPRSEPERRRDGPAGAVRRHPRDRGPRHRHRADRVDPPHPERRDDLGARLRNGRRGCGGTIDLLLSFHSEETPFHRGDAPRGWRHWRGELTVEGARLDAIMATDFFNPTTQRLEQRGNGARFATHTRGETSSLRLTLSGVRAGRGHRPRARGGHRDRLGATVLPPPRQAPRRPDAARAGGPAGRKAGARHAGRGLRRLTASRCAAPAATDRATSSSPTPTARIRGRATTTRSACDR